MTQLNISLPPIKDSPDFDGWLVQVAQYLRDYLGLYDSATQSNFIQSGTGAITRTSQNKMRDIVNAADFGLGVIDNRTALNAAFAASNHVRINAGTYDLGTFTSSENIIDLTSLGDGVSILTEGDVEFTCTTVGVYNPVFFYLSNNSHFYCGPIRFKDNGYDVDETWQGATGFAFVHNGTNDFGNIYLESVYAHNLVLPVTAKNATTPSATKRIRGITIGNLFCDSCYYGYASQNQGDGVEIRNLYAFDTKRAYFVYGATDHTVNIFNRALLPTTGSINICRQVGGLDTKAIKIHYVSRDGVNHDDSHVLINHIDLLGGEISGIDLDLDIESTDDYYPVRFVNYDGSGGSPTYDASLNKVHDITIKGRFDANANSIDSVATYTDAGILSLSQGENFTIATATLGLFQLRGNYSKKFYDPVWAAAGTQPDISNGTLSSRYDLSDGVCHLAVDVLMGSSTTYGTGVWSFTAPFICQLSSAGPVYMLDNGTMFYVGVARIVSGSTTISIFPDTGTGAISSSYPFTWASGDQLIFNLSYPIL